MNPAVDDPSAILMQRVAKGDEAALCELIKTWQNPLINFFYRTVQSRTEAEDLAQVVMIRLYRAAPRYEPTSKFSTYLFSIARRVLLNDLRRGRRKPLQILDPADMPEGPCPDGNRTRRLLDMEEFFQQALQEVPENQRTALLLLKQQELSYREIAEAMNAEESQVKSWIFRARKKIKEQFEKYYE